MRTKSLLLLVPFAIMINSLHAQNLLINGSFEDVNICKERIQACSPSAWFNVNLNLVQGYYNIPEYKAASGDHYLVFPIPGNSEVSKIYWQTYLARSLKKGKHYKAVLKINANKKINSVEDIGFYFTDSFVFKRRDSVIRPASYLDLRDAIITKAKGNWFLVEKDFVATEEYRYLIIGNFSGKGNIAADREKDKTIYFAIDDLEVIDQSYHENNKVKDSLYAITSRHDPVKPDPPPFNPLIDPRLKNKVEVDYDPDTLKIKEILFDFDKYDIKNPEIFDAYKAMLTNDFAKRILVVGYADKVGLEKYNLDLSLKRAQKIAEFLSEKFQIPSSKIEAVGRGKLTAFRDDDKNRRVEIVLYYR